MKNLTLDTFKQMLRNALNRVVERQYEFSQLDAILGDGDHGAAMVTAMQAAVEVAEKGTDYKTMLNDMGFSVMLQTSGSTSTLMGAFFLGMSDCVSGNSLDVADVRKMFIGGLKNIRTQTKAGIGDKTMLDALIPAVEAIISIHSDDIREILKVGAQAANAGAEQTVNMKATFGRARNYSERSIGSADPGATSWACIFTAFAETIQ